MMWLSLHDQWCFMVRAATCLCSLTAYLNIRELAQVGIHGDESMIDQLLVVVGPQHITVLQRG